jgi:hypothetical protein
MGQDKTQDETRDRRWPRLADFSRDSPSARLPSHCQNCRHGSPGQCPLPDHRVGQTAAGIRSIPIATPLPDISLHVIKTQSIGLFLRDRTRATCAAGNIKTSAGVIVGTVGVISGNVVQHRRTAALHDQWPAQVAFVVPARQAYSHCASVGRLYSYPSGKRPAARSRGLYLHPRGGRDFDAGRCSSIQS